MAGSIEFLILDTVWPKIGGEGEKKIGGGEGKTGKGREEKRRKGAERGRKNKGKNKRKAAHREKSDRHRESKEADEVQILERGDVARSSERRGAQGEGREEKRSAAQSEQRAKELNSLFSGFEAEALKRDEAQERNHRRMFEALKEALALGTEVEGAVRQVERCGLEQERALGRRLYWVWTSPRIWYAELISVKRSCSV